MCKWNGGREDVTNSARHSSNPAEVDCENTVVIFITDNKSHIIYVAYVY